MTHTVNEISDREVLLTEVLLEYVEARQAGREIDRSQLLAANPGLHFELDEFFAAHDQIERLAAGLRPTCEQESSRLTTESDVASSIGQLGDFRLLREIGRGGMGVIYEADQISLRRRVALKLLPFAAALDSRQLQRFKNEALAAAQLRHENIVPVYAIGEDRGVHYYAMQFVEGPSLAKLISELKSSTVIDQPAPEEGHRHPKPDPTSPAAVLSTQRSAGSRQYYDWVASVGGQAALALEYAHSVGIVHRDIKPANLLLDPQGRIWVTDFGLALVAGDAGLTMTGEMLGTLRYASPEQVLGRRGTVDQRSDIYSLGATLYELLTWGPIFESRDRNELLRQIAQDEPRRPRRVHASVPHELETIVMKALGKEPSERYLSARELADDLQRFRDRRPVLARPPHPGERLRRLARRHPTLFGAAVVMLTLVSAGSLLSSFLIRQEQQRTKVEQINVQEAYRRERQRAEEAEARFRLARRSVDEMFRISQEELADRPGLEGLRKRILWSVLAYYQEFLDERADDSQTRTDLIETKGRVEKILADLSVLRAASQLYLLVQPAVLDALQLDDEQRPRIKEFCGRVGKEWMESFNEVGRLSPTERGRKSIERARNYESEMNRLLTSSQKIRLRQIGLQAQGPVAFAEPEVVAELQLTAKQREQFRMLEEESLMAWMRRPRPDNAINSVADPSSRQRDERIGEILMEDQALRWRTMTGETLSTPIMPFPAPTPTVGDSGVKPPPQ